MNSSIFRECDIRGIVGQDLTDETVRRIASAIGSFFVKNGANRIAVGFDARESSPGFCELLTRQLSNTGCDVLLIGKVPTPVLYHTVYTKPVDGGVMITGSHNPADHNGFKICLGEETLFGSQIQAIGEIAFSADFKTGSGGFEELRVLENYGEDIVSRIDLGEKRIKVVIDAGNGMGGVTSVPVYRKLGVDVAELFTDPDATFPNHAPDPANPENLTDAIKAVKEQSADLAIAFDGDADRITVIDEKGRIIWGDELTTLFARHVLPENPDSTVVGEVKCSQIMFDEIARLGGNPVMCKAGHSIVKSKMKETGAVLAGEMSGHIFFADRYYGFDDACYAGARLLEILSKNEQSLSELLSEMPSMYSTPEIRVDCAEEKKSGIVEKVADAFSKTNKVIRIDGARIIFETGWGLVRPSNTQEILVLRFEANTKEDLYSIKKQVETHVYNLLHLSD